MGQARIKRQKHAEGPCRCGSGLSGNACCFDGLTFFRQPAKVTLCRENRVGAAAKCYLRATNSCSPDMSREHLFSGSILDKIDKSGLVVSGLPWLNGAEKRVSRNDLVAKCLCRGHNSDLSPLDQSMSQFVALLEQVDLTRTGDLIEAIISGHDIERWMLKTMLAMASSRNFTKTGEIAPIAIHPAFDGAKLLAEPYAWPQGIGLAYLRAADGLLPRLDKVAFGPLRAGDSLAVVRT